MSNVPQNETDQTELVVREAFRLAEVKLASETSLALASDQRAITFAGILIATIAIVVGSQGPNGLSVLGNLSVLCFALAALLSCFGARSVKIFATGVPFDNFKEDIEQKRNYVEVISEMAGHYDNCSRANQKIMSRNAMFFNAALFCAALGFVGIAWPSVSSVAAHLSVTEVGRTTQ